MTTDAVPVPTVRHSLHAVVTALPVDVAASTSLPLPDASLLRRFGASDAEIAEVADRPQVTVLHRSGPADRAQHDAVAARIEALSLAAAHDGRVLDLAVPRLVTHGVDDTDPTVAAQWVALDLDRTDIVSHGLATFGLPELRVVEAGRDQLAASLAVLTGLAHRLIGEWPAQNPVGRATVTLTDIARGLGQPEPPDRRGVDVQITLVDDELHVTTDDDLTALFTPEPA